MSSLSNSHQGSMPYPRLAIARAPPSKCDLLRPRSMKHRFQATSIQDQPGAAPRKWNHPRSDNPTRWFSPQWRVPAERNAPQMSGCLFLGRLRLCQLPSRAADKSDRSSEIPRLRTCRSGSSQGSSETDLALRYFPHRLANGVKRGFLWKEDESWRSGAP